MSKLRLEGNFLNMIKSIYENPTTSSIRNGEIFNAFALKSGKKKGCTLTITTYIQHCPGCHSQYNNAKNK